MGLKDRTQSTAVPLFLLAQLTPTLAPNNPGSTCSLPFLKGFPHFATNRTDMDWGLTDLLFSLSPQPLFPGERSYFCSRHTWTGLATGFDQWKVAGGTLLLQAGIYRASYVSCILLGTFPQSTLWPPRLLGPAASLDTSKMRSHVERKTLERREWWK